MRGPSPLNARDIYLAITRDDYTRYAVVSLVRETLAHLRFFPSVSRRKAAEARDRVRLLQEHLARGLR